MTMDYQRGASARMFQSPFLEACSKIHPAAPFVFYIPIVLGLMLYTLGSRTTSGGQALIWFPLGWVTWDLMEYGIHRGFFHWEGSGPLTRKIHEIAHGYHHRYPDDAVRLVMPLGASIPLALMIAGLLAAIGKPSVTIPYYCGIVSGYLFYDFTHWSSHHRTPKTAWGRAIRSHHLAHHFATPDKNFGISHRWIDALAGTLKKRT
jgi:sterol desaturase/sphingolipid hydroxylase (fatty acid hydroxylase superfamily)